MIRNRALLALLLFLAAPALAQEPPVEITARDALEWDRAARTYVARGEAVARKGTSEVRAATLTAAYAEASGMTAITELVAEGGVTVSSPPYTATGARAVYNPQTGDARLTGPGLRVTANGEELTAKGAIVYSAKTATLSATGGARAVRGEQALEAETLAARFAETASGARELQDIAATGGVTVTTPGEKITGDSGLYDVKAGTAKITGRVRILQGRSTLEGAEAIVDMRTGKSRLTGPGPDGGRVKGVFYPKGP